MLIAMREDGKKVLPKIRGKRPGKACGKSFIAADRKCRSHYTNGKLNEAGKAAAQGLANKVRDRKGMKPIAPPMSVRERREALRRKYGKPGDSGSRMETIARREEKRGMVGRGNDEPTIQARAAKKQAIVDKAMERLGADKPKKAYLQTPFEYLKTKVPNIEQLQANPYDSKRAITLTGKYNNEHREKVEKALAKGVEVPSEVVAEHRLTLRNRISKGFFALPSNLQGKYQGLEPSTSLDQKIKPDNLKTAEDRAAFAKQEAAHQKAQGNMSGAKAWQEQEKLARRSALSRDMQKQKQSQQSLLGVTEHASDMPLFTDIDKAPLRMSTLIPPRAKTIRGRTIDSADERRSDADTGGYKVCGRGWQGVKGSCRRAKKGTGLKASRKQSAIELANRVKAEKLAQRGHQATADLKKKTQEAIAKRKAQSVPKGVTDVDPKALNFDPKRFQYKLIHGGETGSSGSLKGVRRWDENLAGVMQVWRDPKDGKDYVVNGHNRVGKAIELGAESVSVRYLNVPSAKEARSIGALTNIAEGRGNALDAAKFFRDSGLTREELDAKGIPMREKIATDGIALSRLAPHLFDKVVSGDIPSERAVLIGDRIKSHDDQSKLVDLIDRETKKGRKITNDVIRELADTVSSAPKHQETQFSLFGASESSRNLALEKAEIMADVRKRLSRDKKLFGLVSKSKAASELERGGNQIDKARSRDIADQSSQTLAIFDQLKNQSGVVSAAINRATERIANGENKKQVNDELYKALLSDIPDALGIRKTASAGPSEASVSRRRKLQAVANAA